MISWWESQLKWWRTCFSTSKTRTGWKIWKPALCIWISPAWTYSRCVFQTNTEFLWINDSISSLLMQTSFQYSIACGRQGVTFQQTNYIVQICGAFWPLICNRTLLRVLAGGPSVLGKPSLRCHDLRLQQRNEWLHQSHGGRRDAHCSHLFVCWACSLCEKWHFRLIHNLLIQYICSVLFHSEGEIICDICSYLTKCI